MRKIVVAVVVALALAAKVKAGAKIKINLCTGASVGPELDGELAKAGVIARRMPYQTNKDLRDAINTGKIAYFDMHLSAAAQNIRYGFLNNRRGIDVMIVEACVIKDLGNGRSVSFRLPH